MPRHCSPDVDVTHGSDDIPAAQFFSFFFESLFFGIFLVLYGIAVWERRRKCKDDAKESRMIHAVGVSTLMLLLAGAHLIVNVARGYEAFVEESGQPNGPMRYFVSASKPTFMAKSVLYVTLTLLGDAVMGYRAFVVSSYNRYAMLFPAALLIGAAVAGYTACIAYPLACWRLPSITNNEGAQSLAAFLVCTTVSNLFTTTLIITVIVQSNKKARKMGISVPLAAGRCVVSTIIQSGVVYTISLVFLLVTFITGINPEMFCIDALVPLIGISFTLIIVLTRLRKLGDDVHERTDIGGVRKVTKGGLHHPVYYPSMKIPLGTATISSAFKRAGAKADEATTPNENTATEMNERRVTNVKVFLPSRLDGTGPGEAPLDLESGKRGQTDSYF